MKIVEEMLAGNTYMLAKAITMVENESQETSSIMKRIFPHTGNSYIVGITGPPGAGKSTLVDKLVKHLHKEKSRVAVIAVDPSSPFTGGSILGDRVRMNDLNLLEGVFIRSIGTRGNQGGISAATYFVAAILDACGYDYVFIETVGVGQSEIDVLTVADTTFLVLAPGLGDDIQAFKAGIMEVGNAFVVNKADREGAQRLKTEIESVMSLSTEAQRRPVFLAEAENNVGTDELVDFLEDWKSHYLSEKHRAVRLRKKLQHQYITTLKKKLSLLIEQRLSDYENVEDMLDDILNGRVDFYDAVDKNLESIIEDNSKKQKK